MVAHLLAALLGGAAWTLAEYLMHRFDGHEMKGRTHFSRQHLKHHADILWFAPTAEKVRAAAIVGPALGGVGFWLVGAPGLTFAAGFLVVYAAYEVLHRRIHTHAPRTACGRWACRHHLYHHFKSPRANHGVTVPVWDWVFRTIEPVGQLKVPAKQVMPWLLDADGEVKAAFRDAYVVGARRAPQRPAEDVRAAA